MRYLALVLVTGLAACTGTVTQQSTRFSAVPPDREITFASAVRRNAGRGAIFDIPAGSRWQRTGRIAQGDVYARRDGVFQITGQFVYEAALVLRDGALVGFYLPADGTFSPLSEPLALPSAEQS